VAQHVVARYTDAPLVDAEGLPHQPQRLDEGRLVGVFRRDALSGGVQRLGERQ